MMRPKIFITNVDKATGKATSRWYVRIGRQWRWFGHKDWQEGGVEWVKQQLTGKHG